jgi:phage tail-like protein
VAVERSDPYGTFNYLVDLGNGDTSTAKAGFSEVTGLNVEVTTAEYRAGNDLVNHARKLNGTYKVGDVTLKRGLMGATDLFEWVNAVRTGDRSARRSVTIQLRDEAGTQTVMTWKLLNARPMRYTAPALNGRTGTDVAIEELVLSYEDLAVE